ncbi:MAG TPA: hypothetical protein PLK31_02630 [Chloroflexota bacterium]|nr:hypothetical protein [Chloroflexota bacterium]
MTAKINPAYKREFVLLKLRKPTRRKQEWIEDTASRYRNAIEYALQVAQTWQIRSRGKLHAACYHDLRQQFGLTSDLARLAINKTVTLLASYHALQQSDIVQRVSFPQIRRHQGIGLGRDSYKLVACEKGFVLRISTQHPRQFIWFPLHVPDKYKEVATHACGDAEQLIRNQDWYVSLPLRFPEIKRSHEDNPSVIGIDLGLVRLATVVTPDNVVVFKGRAILKKRDKHIRLRQRYWQKGRMDCVKASGRKERY